MSFPWRLVTFINLWMGGLHAGMSLGIWAAGNVAEAPTITWRSQAVFLAVVLTVAGVVGWWGLRVREETA